MTKMLVWIEFIKLKHFYESTLVFKATPNMPKGIHPNADESLNSN